MNADDPTAGVPGQLLRLDTGRPAPGVVVVTASGEIDTSTAPQLRDVLDEARADADHLVVDLAGVTFISSAGINVLVRAREPPAARRAALHLVGVTGNRPVALILDITGLTSRFDIHADVGDALVAIART